MNFYHSCKEHFKKHFHLFRRKPPCNIRFELLIEQEAVIYDHKYLFKFHWRKHNMAAITAGNVGVFVGTVSASDNSTVTATGWVWSASDTSVTIANDASDASGATVDVTVPASDVATTFVLTASASAVSTTQSTPTPVTNTISVTISPASVPVTFTLSIAQKS